MNLVRINGASAHGTSTNAGPWTLAALLISTFVLAICGVTAPAAAQDDGSDGTPAASEFPLVGEVNTDRVNLRTGPSIDYRILRKLQPTEKIVIVHEEGEWFEVRVPGGFVCYVLDRLIDRSNPESITVLGNRVNLRPTAATKYHAAGQVRPGDRLLVVGTEGDWAKVVAPEKITAWVNKRYIDILGPEDDYATELARLSAAARGTYLDKSADPEMAAAQAIRKEVEDDFNETEAMFRDQMASDKPVLDEPAERYRKLAEQEVVPELAERARMRLEAIDRERRTGEAVEQFETVQDDLRRKLAEAQNEFQEATDKVSEEPEKTPTPAKDAGGTIGWIVKSLQLNPFDQSLPAHRLVKGGKTMMLLSSYKYDIADFVDRQVKISGELVALEGTETAHLVIRKMEILSER